MRSIVAIAGLLGAAQAFVARDGNCCFKLTGSGSVSGTVGQLDDGQNRVGHNGLPDGSYCIDSNGGLTDGNGRGCILTPPTTQFQCDVGASPQGGFSVGCDGKLAYNGNTKFYACVTGDNGQNIYTTVTDAQTGCTELTLTADNCKAGCPPPPPPPPPPAQTCPTDLSGPYEFPHLIVPVSKSNPDTAYGTQLFGEVSSDISSIFNFDIPPADSGKKCSLIFLFPDQSELETSSYTFSGDGKIDFALLNGVSTQGTTYNNQPAVATDYGVTTVAPRNAYQISTFDCPGGQAISFKLSSVSGTSLRYFQDYNPKPIGLYITKC